MNRLLGMRGEASKASTNVLSWWLVRARRAEVSSVTFLRAELTRENSPLEPLLTVLGEVGVERLVRHLTPRVELRAGSMVVAVYVQQRPGDPAEQGH